ncbi:MAG: hypothetical protein VX768_05445 [Planctomycetota bacterium]|nr:hypothetical protein [Planctomycetota bacterium]
MVTLTDPAPITSGMAGIRLTGNGQLREISIVPPLNDTPPSKETDPISDASWTKIFKWAGLRFEDFQPTETRWSPPWDSDESHAWIFSDPQLDTPIEIRVEAATKAGRLRYFQVIFPWTSRQWTLPTKLPNQPSGGANKQATNYGEVAQDALFFLLGGPLLVISIVLAIRNLKIGTTDKDGALKFAGVMLLIDFNLGLFEAHHNSSVGLEMTTCLSCLTNALGRTVRFWIYYLALEPFVRRTWPKVLVSWNRLLQGKISDPFVSLEILYGCIFGVVGAAIVGFSVLLNDQPLQTMMGRKLCNPAILSGDLGVIAGFFNVLYSALPAVFTMLVIVVFRLITRIDLIAGVTFIGYMAYISSGPADGPLILLLIAFQQFLIVLIAFRFGLLALVVFNITKAFLTFFPLTLNVDAWFFSTGLIGIGIPVALAISSFFFSMGDKSPLRSSDDGV